MYLPNFYLSEETLGAPQDQERLGKKDLSAQKQLPALKEAVATPKTTCRWRCIQILAPQATVKSAEVNVGVALEMREDQKLSCLIGFTLLIASNLTAN